jgi:DNA replication and repair protein RecF
VDRADTTVARLWLEHFRAIETADVELGTGLTVFVGANAQGKTSLLESIGWIARGRSFRGVTDQVLVGRHHDSAIVRADVVEGARRQRFEAEIRSSGRNRVMLNGSTVNRRRDLEAFLRVSVFAPDDLDLVKSGPSARRDYLDDLLASLARRYDVARGDFDRIVKHRNALLRSGVRDATDRATLEVFDEQLVVAGSEVVRGRLRLVEQLRPRVRSAYHELAGIASSIGMDYRSEWHQGSIHSDDLGELQTALRDAIARMARKEAERRVTLVGPHRDELELQVADLDARTHASQGEQRTLALALRLAGHRLVTEVTGCTPVLLLDDVFSELDDQRAMALVERLPPGQTLLTTAGSLPAGMVVEQLLRVEAGKVLV